MSQNSFAEHNPDAGDDKSGQGKRIFLGTRQPHNAVDDLPDPPPWRAFTSEARKHRGEYYEANDNEKELVNAALYLRRPLLVTGKPGVGKSSLAYAVAHELGLGDVLVWPITTRTTLQQGLYSYDAIARLHAAALHRSRSEGVLNADGSPTQATQGAEPDFDIGRYIRLGPLGTAMLGWPPTSAPAPGIEITQGPYEGEKRRPRVLLIDEIDKSDVDLPNDLLHIFEEGEFEIQELSRLAGATGLTRIKVAIHKGHDNERDFVWIDRGIVPCTEFPLVIMTSNGEREFPPAFRRRCLPLEVKPPEKEMMLKIVNQRLKPDSIYAHNIEKWIDEFISLRDRDKRELATDQLLNVIYMVLNDIDPQQRKILKNALLNSLTESGISE